MAKIMLRGSKMFPSLSMCMAFIMVSSYVGWRCEAKVKLPEGLIVKGVLVFGDSIVDQGMNNNLITIAKCNFPPYGQDFVTGKPTGRFSNGKTPPDLIVEELGIKEFVPAYFDPNLQPEDIKTGVSFASGGCGYDPQTSLLAAAIPLSTQLEYYKEYLVKLKDLVGENETNYIITNTLFAVVAGSDDLCNTYFALPWMRYQQSVNSYTDFMVQGASNFIQELYKLGARNIAFFGLPAVGCLPSQRTLAGLGQHTRECAKNYNDAAQLVNSKFSTMVDSLVNKLPQSKIVYIDIYNPFLDLIQNPQNYGFNVVDKGCCGTGLIEVTLLCNKLSGTCPNHEEYLFWDSFHPTEKGYRILVKQIVQKYIGKFA